MPINFLYQTSFPDEVEITFGDSGDMKIYHDGTESNYVTVTAGDLYIRNESNSQQTYIQATNGSGTTQNYIKLDGAQELTELPKNTKHMDNVYAYFGNSADAQIYHNGTDTWYFMQSADNGYIDFRNDDGSGSMTSYLVIDGNNELNRFYKRVQLEDNVKLTLGNITTPDLEIYHDGSNSYIDEVGTGSLYIRSAGAIRLQSDTGENMIYAVNDGAVNLYHNNVKTFETTASGIAITGGLTTSASSTMNAKLAINSTATDILTLDGRASGSYSSSQINFKAGDSAGSWNAYKITYVKTATADQLQLIDGGGTAHVVFNNGGDVEFLDYGSGTFTGTATYFLTVDSSGNIIENAFSSAGLPGGPYLPLAGGNMTGDLVCNDGVAAAFGTGIDAFFKHDGSNFNFFNDTGNVTFTNRTDDGNMSFACDDGSGGVETYFHLSGSTEQTLFLKDTEHQDSVKAQFGNQGDMKMYHDGTSSYIENTTGHLYIMQRTNDSDLVLQCDDGSGGDTTYLRLDGSSKRIDIPDSIPLCFGDGDDLQFQHNGSTSYIQNFTGDLQIQNNADDADILFRSDDGAGGLATYFYLDGSGTKTIFEKLTRHVDDVNATFGNADDLRIYHNGTNSNIENFVGDLQIIQNLDDGDINFKSDDGSGGTATYFFLDGSEVRTTFNKEVRFIDNAKLKLGTSGDLEIFHDGSDSYLENYTGTFYFTQHTNDGNMAFKCDDGSGGTTIYFTLDGGSAATDEYYTKWKDNSRVALGDGKDLVLYHNGSNSYISEVGTGDLYIQSDGQIRLDNPTDGEKMARFYSGAVTNGVELFHDNALKIATISTGVQVTGLTDTDSLLIGTSTTVTAILDEDNMASDSATALATQQSIKAYVDSSTTGVLTYQGTWNADTNSPTLSSGSGTPGYYYIVSVAGSTDLDGITDWAVGDWAVFSDLATDAWQKIDNTQVGNVTGSGADNRIALWNGTSSIDSDSDFYVDGDTIFTNNLSATGSFSIGGDINKTSGDLTLDVAGDITLDAAGNDIRLFKSGVEYGKFKSDSNNLAIFSSIENEDILFKGNDGGSTITALTLDMSNAGYAYFNDGISAGAWSMGTGNITDDIYHVGDTNTYFGFGGGADTFRIVTAGTSALTIDSSQAITCTGDVQVAGMYIGAVNISYDLYNNGTSYFNGNVIVDDALSITAGALSISGDGSNAATLTESSDGEFKIASVTDLTLDAGGGDIILSDDATIFGTFSKSGNDLQLRSRISDGDLILRGVDGGSTIDALTLDMSEGGSATFNDDINYGGKLTQTGTTANTFAGNIVLDDGSGATPQVQWINGSDDTGAMYLNSSGKLQIVTSGSVRQEISSGSTEFSGACMPSADSTYDLGTTSYYWANAYIDVITTTGTITAGGNLTLSSASSPTLTITDTTNDCILKMYSQDSSSVIGTYSNHALKLFSNSTQALEFDTSQNATFAGIINTSDGSATTPAYNFTSHDGNGMYLEEYDASSNKEQVSIATDGVRRFRANEAGIWSDQNVYFTGSLRKFGAWEATSGTAGEGFSFQNTADSTTPLSLTSTGNATFTGTITSEDITCGNLRINEATNPNLQLYRSDATTQLWELSIDSSGRLLFQEAASSGGTQYTRFQIDDTGESTFFGTVHLDSDSAQLQLGDDNDMQVYHNGANGFVKVGTGDLILQSDGDDIKILAEDDVVIRDNDDSTEMAKFINGGAVELYHNGSKKFETTSTGADIDGTLTLDTLAYGASTDTRLEWGMNTFSIINTSGTVISCNSSRTVSISENLLVTGITSDGNITLSGTDLVLSGDSNIQLDTSLTSGGSGTIINFGSTSVTATEYYILNGSSGWDDTQADAASTSKGLIAVALGTGTASTVGMLTHGIYYHSSHGFTIGAPLYLSADNNNVVTTTAPSSSSEIVRVMGYAIDANHIYFCPDNTWIQIS